MNLLRRWRVRNAIAVCLLAGTVAVPYCQAAQDGLDELSLARLQSDQKTQQINEEWDDVERKLRAEIARETATFQQLESRSQRFDQMLTVEERRIKQQQHRLVESQKLRDGLQRWLQELRVKIENQSGTTLPFLVAERQERLESLAAVVNDPYVSLDEQFRRVFEVLLVEAEYGYSSEVYRDKVAIEGEVVEVDLLRVGRLALLFRTLDHQGVGMYDPVAQQYHWLPSDHLSAISQTFAVVRRESAAQMVILPVGRIEQP